MAAPNLMGASGASDKLTEIWLCAAAGRGDVCPARRTAQGHTTRLSGTASGAPLRWSVSRSRMMLFALSSARSISCSDTQSSACLLARHSCASVSCVQLCEAVRSCAGTAQHSWGGGEGMRRAPCGRRAGRRRPASRTARSAAPCPRLPCPRRRGERCGLGACSAPSSPPGLGRSALSASPACRPGHGSLVAVVYIGQAAGPAPSIMPFSVLSAASCEPGAGAL